ncbi:MAG: cohesin domain-containing protein [Bacillota bacterium]|nr:cohesin domain-containing protein [Bacillota bacterium]
MYNKKKKVSCLLASTMLFSLIPAMSAFAASSVSVSYSPSASSGTGSSISGTITITNTGSSAIDLSTLTIKNYFTADGISGFVYDSYYTNAPVAPTVAVSSYSPAISTADSVATYSFASGSLAAGASITLNGAIRNGSYSSMNLGNDYTSATNAPAVFVSGTLVAGKTPVPPVTSTPTPSPKPTATPTPIATPTPDPTAFGITIGKVAGTAGATVVVPVTIKNVPTAKLDALNFIVKYDSTKLTFVSAAAGSIVPSTASVYTDATTAGSVGVLYADESGANTGAVSAAGTIVNLTFKVATTVTGSIPLTIDTTTTDGLSAATAAVDASGNNGEITNITTTAGSVTFGGPTPTPTPVVTPVSGPLTGIFNTLAPADITVAVPDANKATNPIVGVYAGATKLYSGIDQQLTSTTAGYSAKIFKSFLSKFALGSHVITFKFKDGTSVNLTFYVTNGIDMTPLSAAFTKASPADVTVALTDSVKATNPIIGVYNGSTGAKLASGVNQQLTSTTAGYSAKIYKSYLSTLPTGTNSIVFKFKDGSLVKLYVVVK